MTFPETLNQLVWFAAPLIPHFPSLFGVCQRKITIFISSHSKNFLRRCTDMRCVWTSVICSLNTLFFVLWYLWHLTTTQKWIVDGKRKTVFDKSGNDRLEKKSFYKTKVCNRHVSRLLYPEMSTLKLFKYKKIANFQESTVYKRKYFGREWKWPNVVRKVSVIFINMEQSYENSSYTKNDLCLHP